MLDNVNTLTLGDPDFPGVLRPISTPPQQIYWRGQHPNTWIHKPKVAVVGSRKMTAYGKVITEKLVTGLVRQGVVIISGLAYGIDITSHRAALGARGTTVAILPGGLDSIYPPSHYHVAQHIAENGTLITEYPEGTPSYPSNFIARNRLISGLCDVLLIPEAALKSGSLHTARFGLEQGKTVMAVPGNINSPFSEGCNNLIKSGAIPVTSVEDILFALKIKPSKRQTELNFSGNQLEEAIFTLIKEGISAQEELAAVAKLEGAALSSTLTMLEISGYIRPAGGGHWVIA